jgi:hypothetical protein
VVQVKIQFRPGRTVAEVEVDRDAPAILTVGETSDGKILLHPYRLVERRPNRPSEVRSVVSILVGLLVALAQEGGLVISDQSVSARGYWSRCRTVVGGLTTKLSRPL